VVLEVGSVVLFWVLVVVVVVVVAVVAVAEVAAAATRSQEGHMVRVVAGSCM
jgi:hypothetical protein